MPFALTVFMHAYACIEIKKIVGAPPKIDARVLENQRYFLPWPKHKKYAVRSLKKFKLRVRSEIKERITITTSSNSAAEQSTDESNMDVTTSGHLPNTTIKDTAQQVT